MISFGNDIYPFLYKNFNTLHWIFQSKSFAWNIFNFIKISECSCILKTLVLEPFSQNSANIFFQVELLSKQNLSVSGRYRTWFKSTSHLFRFEHLLCLFHSCITWNDKKKKTINLTRQWNNFFIHIFKF